MCGVKKQQSTKVSTFIDNRNVFLDSSVVGTVKATLWMVLKDEVNIEGHHAGTTTEN